MLKLIELYQLRTENRKLKIELKTLNDAFKSLAREATNISVTKQADTIKISALLREVDSLARNQAD